MIFLIFSLMAINGKFFHQDLNALAEQEEANLNDEGKIKTPQQYDIYENAAQQEINDLKYDST